MNTAFEKVVCIHDVADVRILRDIRLKNPQVFYSYYRSLCFFSKLTCLRIHSRNSCPCLLIKKLQNRKAILTYYTS